MIPGLPDVAWWVSLSLRRALLNHHEYASFSRRLFLAIRPVCKLGGVLKTAGTQRVAETVGPTAANASQHGGFATVDPCWDRQTDGATPYRYINPVPHTVRERWRSCYCSLRQVSCSVLFCGHPRSECWPHHGRTFSIYLNPLSF